MWYLVGLAAYVAFVAIISAFLVGASRTDRDAFEVHP